MATTTDKPKLTTYVSGTGQNPFTVQLGPFMKIVGKLVNVRATKDKNGDFRTICPSCATKGLGVAMNQMYQCPNPDHSDITDVYPIGQCAKGKQIGTAVVPVDKDEVAAAKKSELPLNIFAPTIHPVDEIRSLTWADTNAYVMIPNNENDEAYGLMVRLVRESGRGFLGLCNLRHNEGLFKLDVWQEHLVVQKVVLPSECNIIEGDVNTPDDKTYKLGLSVLAAVSEEFDPSTYALTHTAKLSAMNDKLAALAAGAPNVTIAQIQASKQPAGQPVPKSLADQLADFLAVNKPAEPVKKTVAKKTPAAKKKTA